MTPGSGARGDDKMKRAKILDKAKEMVTGQREQDYGTPEDNFNVIAEYWMTYLSAKWGPEELVVLTADDVANMMCLFKIARVTTGKGTADSYIDLAGYAACAGEILGGNDDDDQ